MSQISSISSSDVHRITSGQVIIDLCTAVKELVDNSIDAEAHQIEITFKNYGVNSFECSDDGIGISPDNYEVLALKNYTSKISSFQDLTTVKTLGFRGEALSSLCAIAQIAVTTTVNPPRADKLEYDFHGKLISKTTTSRNKGTSIQVSNLFHNLPVRRKEFIKNSKKQFAKCISILQSYAIIQSDIRFSVWNVNASGRKQSIISTNRLNSMRKNILNLFGPSSLQGIVDVEFELDLNPFKSHFSKKYLEDDTFEDLDYKIKVSGLISLTSFGCGRNSKDRQYTFINKRPVTYQLINKCCNDIYRTFNNVQYPSFYLNFEISTGLIDINVTPDKLTVLFHNERYVLDNLKNELSIFFDKQEAMLPKGTAPHHDSQSLMKLKPEIKNESNGLPSSQFSDASDSQATYSPPRSQELDASFELNTQLSVNDTVTRENDSNLQTSSESSQLSVVDSTKDFEDNEMEVDIIKPRSSKRNIAVQLSSFVNPNVEEDIDFTKDADSDIIDSGKLVMEFDDEKQEHSVAITRDDRMLFVEDLNNDKTVIDKEESNESSCCSSEDDESLRVDFASQETNIRTPKSQNWEMDDNASHVLRFLSHDETIGNLAQKPIYRTLQRLTSGVNTKNQIPSINSSQQSSYEGFLDKMSKKKHRFDNVEEGEKYLTLSVSKDDFNKMEVVGQFNLGFIIATRRKKNKFDLFIIDQHASDEKYNFETLQKTTSFKSQRLIAPQPVEMSVLDELLVIENKSIFEKNGFKFTIDDENVDEPKIKLTCLPISKKTLFDIDDFNELIYLIKKDVGISKEHIRCSKIRSMFAMRACRSSIMIGKPLSQKTMAKVVKNLSGLHKPWNCPHGRPTMRHLIELDEWDYFKNDYAT